MSYKPATPALPCAGGAAGLTIELITREEEFLSLKGEWNVLLQSTPADTIFLTWEWISTWWRVYGAGAHLHVLTARDENGRLIGVAPLQRVRHRILGFWGFETIQFLGWGKDVTPEQLDFMIKPGFETAVVTAFVKCLWTDSGTDGIDLRPLREDSRSLALLARLLAERGEKPHRSVDSICPVFDLPESQELFLAKQSRNYRKKIGEYERRCERELATEMRVSETPAEAGQDLDALVALHRKRWGRVSRAFKTPEYRRFHHELAERLLERGWARIFSLESGLKKIALLYCFSYGEHYYYYQGGWDPGFARYRVGLVLMHKVISRAIAEKAKVFEFLRGEETYKYRWATGCTSNIRLACWWGASARAHAGMSAIFAGLLRHGRRSVTAPADPNHFPPHWLPRPESRP